MGRPRIRDTGNQKFVDGGLAPFGTWANSWSTTHRYHESVLWPCIFGCNREKDELVHYIGCTRFWSGICSASNLSLELIQVDPLIKLCLLSPSELWAVLMVVAFQSYHAIKMEHRASVQNAVDTDNWHKTACLLSDCASHYWSENRLAFGNTPRARHLLPLMNR